METNIILCSDGTGNTTIKDRGTNVFKLFEAINTHHSTPQIAIYDDGVGSGTSKVSQILGGAFGYGLSRNVRELYTSLVRNYNSGDKIYLFGFSRGAFTVRSLAGMISYMGVLDRNHCKTDAELNDYVKHAYREYRRSQRAWLERALGLFFVTPAIIFQRNIKKKKHLLKQPEFKKLFSTKLPTPEHKLIRFIGVWDTVSAVGFPVPLASWFVNTFIYRFSFSDNDLNQDVEHASQALSIDDQRKTFKPEVWNEKSDDDKNRIDQVWFAGVHANVGGGYPKQGMSLVSLIWMMHKAQDAGIKFITHDLDLYTARQNVYDKLYDSRHGINVYYRFKPRNIFKICKQHDLTPRIHSSAINRIYRGTAGYAPGNIPNGFEVDDVVKIPCNWPTANTEVEAALNKDSSLLQRVPILYGIRKFSHGLFFIATLYAIYEFCINHPEIFEKMDFSGITLKFLTYLFTEGECFFKISCVLVAMAAFYGVLIFTKNKMHSKFSAFWYSLINK